MSNTAQQPLRYSVKPWQLKQCAGCHFVYLENPPAYEELSDEFAWEQTSRAEKSRRAEAEPVVYGISRKVIYFRRNVFKRDKLRRLLHAEFSTGNIVDVGCSRGKALAAVPPGCVPYGIEISRQLAARSNEIAAARGGKVVHNNGVDGIKQFPAGFFQGAILSSYLEHETQPAELLEALRSAMASGGKVIIKVPNFGCLNRKVRGRKWCGFRFPDHVNYFTPASLRRLVESRGFRVARFRFSDHHPLSDNMWMIAQAA